MEEEKKDVKEQDAKATNKKVEKKETKPAEKKEEKKVTDKKTTSEVKKETKKQEVSKDTNKKSKEAKVENKKNNTGMIIGVAIVLVVVIAILAYIFLTADSPKKSVEDMLKDLKSGNYNEIVISDLSEEDFDADTQKLLFDKLEWKVKNVKEEQDTATVEIEITNKDFKTVIANYMQKMLKLAFSGENVTEEEMTNYLIEELKNDEIETIMSNKIIILKKQDGKWEVSEENNFVDILLPGFNEAINAFN